jgi:hypothetical protein
LTAERIRLDALADVLASSATAPTAACITYADGRLAAVAAVIAGIFRQAAHVTNRGADRDARGPHWTLIPVSYKLAFVAHRAGYWGGESSCPRGREARERSGVRMRRLHVLVAMASAGLVAASLVLAAPSNAAPVHGTGGPDHLRGTPFKDTIRGFGGNDTVHALAGPDLIFGGSGFDTLYAQRGADTVYGGTQGDLIFGGQGPDTIFGGAGRDTIYDGPGADAVYAGAGQDTIVLANDRSRDRVSCGRGYDVVYGANGNTIRGDCEEVHGRQ